MKTFIPRVGERVMYKRRSFEIETLIGLTRCLLRSDNPGEKPISVALSQLSPLSRSDAKRGYESEDLSHVPEKLLAFAKRRLEIILPLLGIKSRKLIEEAAEASGLSYATLNRSINKYNKTGRLESLVPMYELRGAPRKPRLSKKREGILDRVINDFYLVQNGPSITETHKEVKQACLDKRVPAPSLSTVRNRILAIKLRVSTRARKGKKALKKLNTALGTMPGAERPWMIIQIDHTVVDVMIVDRETRLPIGRAYITVALDAATRVVVGFYVSLDPPSELAVGTCLVNSMLAKEAWLKKLGVPGSWPVWGQPKTIQVDNALEFHSKSLRRGCGELGIHLEWRRAGHPEDGGRIERFMRTLMEELHILPGSTFSNPKQRGEYDSEGKAVMTLDELERYIADWIVTEYHVRPHKGLNQKTPLEAWEEGWLNHGGLPGLVLPVRHTDPDALLMSFLPGKECTVQTDGIHLNGIRYWHEHLRRWRGVKEPGNEKDSKRFLVRLDPRNISRIWFHDPRLNRDIPIRYANLTRPQITLWEWKATGKGKSKQGNKTVNEAERFASRERRKAIPASSAKLTKKVRREKERDERRQETALKFPTLEPAEAAQNAPKPGGAASWLADLKPFDEIEN